MKYEMNKEMCASALPLRELQRQTGEKSSVQSSDLYSQVVLVLKGTSNQLSGPQFPKP